MLFRSLAAKINVETGEIIPYRRINNLPSGKSVLKYKSFALVNNEAIKTLSQIMTNEEMGIIFKMIQKADFNTNSLKPFSDDSSIRMLAEEFNIGKNKVNSIFKKLFEFGVYAHIKIHENKLSEYWILNPYISWKGSLKSDSIFHQFSSTKIAKLLN